jgi:small subunit ribosomal protein S15
MITKEAKEKLIKTFGKSPKDVGSCEVQIAIFSERIRQISEHLKAAKKDHHSQRGLLNLVGRRRTFLNYLKKNDLKSYENVLGSLKEHGYI